MEHRWGERLLVNLPVRVSAHAFSSREGRLIDLSVSGAHLEADLDVRVLSRVEVTIVLPQRARMEAHPIAAYVARRCRDGLGLEWCEFSPPEVAELLRNAARHPYSCIRRPVAAAHASRVLMPGSLLKHPG